MKVSIITATYNSSSTIDKCVKSVLNQTYLDIEYIIVDGCSSDNTLSIIKELSKDFSNVKISSERDKGIYDALNKGIAKASGDIIGFVHSDDFLAKKTIIDTMVKTFQEKRVDGIYGNLHYVAYDNPKKVIRNWVSEPFHYKLLKRGWMPAHPTLYLKKELYNINGGFDLSYKIAADYDFILRIFKQKDLKFYYLPVTIMKMRMGGVSNKNVKNIIQKTKEDYRAIKNNNIGSIYTVVLKNLLKIKQFVN